MKNSLCKMKPTGYSCRKDDGRWHVKCEEVLCVALATGYVLRVVCCARKLKYKDMLSFIGSLHPYVIFISRIFFSNIYLSLTPSRVFNFPWNITNINHWLNDLSEGFVLPTTEEEGRKAAHPLCTRFVVPTTEKEGSEAAHGFFCY